MTERDKFLTEAMGWPWHEVVSIDNFKVTCSCGMSGYMNQCDNLNFSTWDGFGKLWTWAQKQEWFDLFQCCLYYHEYLKDCHKPGDEKLDNDKVVYNELIHPDRFADAVCAFLKDRA